MIPDAGEGARLPEGDRSLFKLLSVTPTVACFLCLDAKGQVLSLREVAVIVEVKTSYNFIFHQEPPQEPQQGLPRSAGGIRTFNLRYSPL